MRTRSSRPVAPCTGVTGFGSRSPPGSAATPRRRRTGSARITLHDERHGAGIFVVRLRTRNGVIPAKVNKLVLVEFDGPRDELEAKYGITLPPSLAVLSRRGEHVYIRAPDGTVPGKFEIADSGVSWSGDGVLISAGSLHESGHVYAFVDPDAPLLEPDQELYEELRRLARKGGNSGPRVVAPGEPIHSPGRRPLHLLDQPAAGPAGARRRGDPADGARCQRALRPTPERRRGPRPGGGRRPSRRTTACRGRRRDGGGRDVSRRGSGREGAINIVITRETWG